MQVKPLIVRLDSDQAVACRLGITHRQVRRIKAGRVSAARLREHLKTDRSKNCRPCLRRARAAFPLRRAGWFGSPVHHVCNGDQDGARIHDLRRDR